MTEAQQAEATDGLVDVEYGGEIYKASVDRLTWETLDRDSEGHHQFLVAELLGDEEFARFKANNPHPFVRRDGELVNVLVEFRAASLVALGNPKASSDS